MQAALQTSRAPIWAQPRLQRHPSAPSCVHPALDVKCSAVLARRELLISLGAIQILPAYADVSIDAVEQIDDEPLQQQAPQPQATFATLSDETLAYELSYPTSTAAGAPLDMLTVRRPERYSSAAPLTADARQRTVAELADLRQGVVVSVSVGPPGGLLAGRPPAAWTPKAVAEQVLIDRSTARVTNGQRVSLRSVEAAEATTRDDGQTYWVYEHVSQGSPTSSSPARETYRHSLAVTALRPGLAGTPFLYTLNLTCPQALWAGLEGPFRRSVDSFRLLPPGPGYVAPDKDPWALF